jgi:hypothetical protein
MEELNLLRTAPSFLSFPWLLYLLVSQDYTHHGEYNGIINIEAKEMTGKRGLYGASSPGQKRSKEKSNTLCMVPASSGHIDTYRAPPQVLAKAKKTRKLSDRHEHFGLRTWEKDQN